MCGLAVARMSEATCGTPVPGYRIAHPGYGTDRHVGVPASHFYPHTKMKSLACRFAIVTSCSVIESLPS